MYKMTYLLMLVTYCSISCQLRICTPKGHALPLNKEVFHQCKTFINVTQCNNSSDNDPILLGCSNKVPYSFLNKIFKGKMLHHPKMIDLCYLLHVGVYVENNRWIHNAKQRLLSLISKKNDKRQDNALFIEKSFHALEDTLCLEMLKKSYIDHNNKYYTSLSIPQRIYIKKHWSCVASKHIGSTCYYFCIDINNHNLFAVSSDKTLFLTIMCPEVYVVDNTQSIITKNGAVLSAYDCCKKKETVVYCKHLDDVKVSNNVMSGWNNYTLHYWNLHSFDEQVVSFESMFDENIDSLVYRMCTNPNLCLFVFSNNENNTYNNKIVIMSNQHYKEQIALIPSKIEKCLSTQNGDYIALQYKSGTIQIIDVHQRKETIIHQNNRLIKHFSISADNFYWLISYYSKNNSPPLIMLYTPQTRTKQYIPLGNVDSIVLAEFDKKDNIHLLVKKNVIYKALLIPLNFINTITNRPLQELVIE